MKSIFVVDDSPTVRLHIKQTLENLGYSVHLAEDGQQASECLPELDTDLLITDYHMPQLNGIELAKRVRKMADKRFLPILMMTTESDEKHVRLGKEIGVSAWLNKGTDIKRLPGLVRLLIGD